MHFHFLRGVSPQYETEETGGNKALFLKNVREDLAKFSKRHDQVVDAEKQGETELPSATPGSSTKVPIANVKANLETRRKVYRRQFPGVLGNIPDDWDFKPTADEQRAIEASIGNVERHGDTPGAPTPAQTLVTVGAKLKRADGSNVDTTGSSTFFSGPGWEIFVMSWTGELHMSSHLIGRRHHSSLLAGKDTAAAGEMRVVDGTIKQLSNKSGHYKPQNEDIVQCLHLLHKRGVTLDFTVVIQDAQNKTKTEPAEKVYNEADYRAGKREFAKDWAKLKVRLSHSDLDDEVAVSRHLNKVIAAQEGWTSVEVADEHGGDPTFELRTSAGVQVNPGDAYRAYKAYIKAGKANPLEPRVIVGGEVNPVGRPRKV